MKKTALALVGVVLLAFGGTAGATGRKLPLRDARKLARQLADRELQKRDIVHQHVSRSYRRVGLGQIIFRYNDRNTSENGNGATCTANIVVRWKDSSQRRAIAHFANVRCTVPSS